MSSCAHLIHLILNFHRFSQLSPCGNIFLETEVNQKVDLDRTITIKAETPYVTKYVRIIALKHILILFCPGSQPHQHVHVHARAHTHTHTHTHPRMHAHTPCSLMSFLVFLSFLSPPSPESPHLLTAERLTCGHFLLVSEVHFLRFPLSLVCSYCSSKAQTHVSRFLRGIS